MRTRQQEQPQQQRKDGRGREIIHPPGRSLSLSLVALSKRAIAGVQGNAHPSGFPNLLRYHPSPHSPFSVSLSRCSTLGRLAHARPPGDSMGLRANEPYHPRMRLIRSLLPLQQFSLLAKPEERARHVARPGENPLARARQEIGV